MDIAEEKIRKLEDVAVETVPNEAKRKNKQI